jgi:hypothetical protein
MAINPDKPHLWKADIAASVDLFNQWFLLFAPKAYRDSRAETTVQVEEGIRLTNDLMALTSDVLLQHPGVLRVLRMAICPPLTRDRLVGLAYAGRPRCYVVRDEGEARHLAQSILKHRASAPRRIGVRVPHPQLIDPEGWAGPHGGAITPTHEESADGEA